MDTYALAKEISEITGWNPAEVARNVLQALENPGSQIEQTDQQDKIEAWDAAAPDAIFEQMVASHRDEQRAWRASIIQTLEAYRGETRSVKLLDYGGGVGTSSLMFAEHCQQITYFDVPGSISEFAGKRFAYRHTPITQIGRIDQYQAKFDAVVALDFSARFANPLDHLKELARVTKPGGLLFLGEPSCSHTLKRSSPGARQADSPDKMETLLQEQGCRFLKTVAGGIHVYVKGPPITVMLHIRQASDLTGSALKSLCHTHPGYPVQWLFVYDGPPDAQMQTSLEAVRASTLQPASGKKCHKQAGIVHTTCEAISSAAHDDVIFLNSDILVYDGWVRKLVEAAYHAPEIGTAMPLTNRGSLYALFPDSKPGNELHLFLEEEDCELIDIPTGEGFCLFIKREALADVGFFDNKSDKGDEAVIDFCRRASMQGYRHVLTPGAFVFHIGADSLSSNKANDDAAAGTPVVLAQRSPELAQAVQLCKQSAALKTLAHDLSQRYITHQSARRPALAQVLHHGVFGHDLDVLGGTGFHIRDLVDDLHKNYIFYIISANRLNSAIRVTGYADGVKATVKWDSDDYTGLLKTLNAGLIHIHHTLYFPPAFVAALIRWKGPKVFTVHDYYALCPNHTLLNDRGEFCYVPEQRECARCANQLFQTGSETPQRQRALHQQLVDSVDMVLAPSQSALAIFRKGIRVPDYKTRVFPHPMPGMKLRAASPAAASAQDDTRQLTVGFIGYNSAVKGNALVDEIIKHCAHDPIRFVAIGNLANTFPPGAKVISTGIYKREQVLDLIKSHHLDVMVIASRGAETYSFTLSETWMAGVPVIVGPLGAPAERVASSGAGLVAPDYQVDTFVSILRALAEDRARLARLKEAVASVPLLTDYAQYQALYTQLACQFPQPTSVFIAAQGFTQIENERLYQELEALRADAALLSNSRGVKMIKLARVARSILATQGPLPAMKHTLLWLAGKRGQQIKRLA